MLPAATLAAAPVAIAVHQRRLRRVAKEPWVKCLRELDPAFPDNMIFIACINNDEWIGSALLDLMQRFKGQSSVSSITQLSNVSSGDILIAASDSCRLDWLQYWEKLSRQWKLPFFCIYVDNGMAIIGSQFYPDQPGCLNCWHKRYYSGRAKARRFCDALSTPENKNGRDSWVSSTTASLIAEIAAQRILADRRTETGQSHPSVYLLDLRKLTGKEWPLLPDSSCTCARPRFDMAVNTRLELKNRPKLEAQGDRVRDIRKLEDKIHDTYVGPGGIVSGVTVSWPFHPGALALAKVDLVGRGRLEVCAGQSDRYSRARTIAVIEALERYTSAFPRGRQVAVRATVDSLGDLAINPRVFGLYSDQQYESNPKLLTPYRDDLELDFVWAYSMRRSHPVLIPRHVGFYSLIGVHDEPAFVVEGSNGCATGSCPEEAIFHGLLEVIERDALLLTWYSKKTPPRINLLRSTDSETRCRLRLLENRGFCVKCFDTTTDFGVPAILLLAVSNGQEIPAAVCVPAAHIYPELAIRKGIRELCAMADRLHIEIADRRIRDRIEELTEDITQAREALDHPLCYCSPASLPQFDFLLNGQEETSIEELTDRSRDLWSNDLGIELQLLLQRVLRRNMDVIVVNHTSPEHSEAGLYNYKVLVPGTVPMGWGAHLQRFEGIARFQSVLGNNAPNTAPHPFA